MIGLKDHSFEETLYKGQVAGEASVECAICDLSFLESSFAKPRKRKEARRKQGKQ